jgi:hypothetical protein
MKKTIVITSINPPTEAVLSFSKLDDYQLILVGDKKTPLDWHCTNVKYLSVAAQAKLGYKLSGVLPYNHYSRKMMGYLYSIDKGAHYIVDTDDDNIPKEQWCFPEFVGKYDCTASNQGFVNIYQLYTNQHIWPRGLPLNYINTHNEIENSLSPKDCRVGIWQGLADEDPDVDAIYRLTSNEPCKFDKRNPVVLDKGTVSPFNTQNTVYRKELFPLMYLPTYVTFRFTDILRGLIAQPIMWQYDYRLGFTNATVVQKRNPHDYMLDFISEIPMYQHCEAVIDLVASSLRESDSISTNLYNAYSSLLKENIICSNEMQTLEAWLKDLQTLNCS